MAAGKASEHKSVLETSLTRKNKTVRLTEAGRVPKHILYHNSYLQPASQVELASAFRCTRPNDGPKSTLHFTVFLMSVFSQNACHPVQGFSFKFEDQRRCEKKINMGQGLLQFTGIFRAAKVNKQTNFYAET